MPTYAYRCSACEHEFDAVQSFHDDPLTLCPQCGAAAAKRVFRNVGVIFKGSGWYINDTRKDRKHGGSTAPKDDATDATEAPAAKSEAADAPATKDAAPSKPAKDATLPAGKSSDTTKSAAPAATS